MKIVVAIRQVPERGAPVRLAASGRSLEEDSLPFALNEPDAYALEQAFALQEKQGGEVVALSVGPERAADTLREALAKGADRALHILADRRQNLDALAIARLLAAAIRTEGPDLVLAGLQSEDAGHGQTGVLTAALLGLPHATLVLGIEKTDFGVRVRREMEEGWQQTVELPLPAVLAVQSGSLALRYATLMGIRRARTKELHTIPAEDLAAEMQPVVTVEEIVPPRRQRATQMIGGSPQQAAEALVEKLRNEAHVL